MIEGSHWLKSHVGWMSHFGNVYIGYHFSPHKIHTIVGLIVLSMKLAILMIVVSSTLCAYKYM